MSETTLVEAGTGYQRRHVHIWVDSGERYRVDGDIDRIMPLVRQAVELGADLIKADPSDDVSQYGRVIEAASGCPVLLLGGSKISDKDLVLRTYKAMQLGATFSSMSIPPAWSTR